MKAITELKKLGLEGPAFIIGNGMSKQFYTIETLGRYGFIFGCNLAWKEHECDFLGFRDDDVLAECAKFKGIKIAWSEVPTRKDGPLVSACENVYYWFYHDDANKLHTPWPKVEYVKRGSTGFILAQVALKMGLKPIVLVGCDCSFLPGHKRSNTIIDDTGFSLGFMRDRNNKFKNQFEAFAAHAKIEGFEVFRLGRFGSVEVPEIQVDEIQHWKMIRDDRGNFIQ